MRLYSLKAVVRRFTIPSPTVPNALRVQEELECGHVIRARGSQTLFDIVNEVQPKRQCFECGRLGVK